MKNKISFIKITAILLFILIAFIIFKKFNFNKGINLYL